MIASKFTEDHYYSNRHFSKVGGIREEDINALERQFLASIDFNLWVAPEELAIYVERLDSFAEIQQHKQAVSQGRQQGPGLPSPTPSPSSSGR